MSTRNGYSIQWTVDNLPSSIAGSAGSSTFSYDPERQRFSQSATFNGATTATAYIGGLFEVVSTSSSTEYRHNVIADGQVIAVHTITQSGSASTDYLHYDHLGSVDAISNDQGAVIQAMSFDAFGLRRDATNWDYDLSQNTLITLKNYTDRGYTFQEQLDNVGLVHLNGRVYDPTVGRMISADPTVPDALFSQAFNRFAYVYDSPLVNVVPTGLGSDPCQGKIVEAINVGGSSTRGQGDACPLGPVTVTGTPVPPPPPPSLNSTNTTSTPGDGPQSGTDNGPNPGKNPNNNNPQNKPQQKPKQQPKQSCNKNIVKGANFVYDFGASMQKTAGAGMLLASPAVETPPGAALEASGVAVGAGGVVLQGTAGLVLLYETGDISPVQNSTIVFAVSFTGDFMVGQPGEAVADVAVGNFLGNSTASCPGQ